MQGEGNRQWFEAHYFHPDFEPIGKIEDIVPAGPDHPDNLLDACIAFSPRFFEECPSLPAVKKALGNETRLDFDLELKRIPPEWAALREEARPLFADLNIWLADLVPINAT